jgi:hypothetical protein
MRNLVGLVITDRRVDAYIDNLPEWQQAICQEVRKLVHEADPEVSETVKRTVQPYFVLNGNICALLATNATGRTVAIYEGEKINRRALKAIFTEIIAHNRAGGWRKLGRDR